MEVLSRYNHHVHVIFLRCSDLLLHIQDRRDRPREIHTTSDSHISYQLLQSPQTYNHGESHSSSSRCTISPFIVALWRYGYVLKSPKEVASYGGGSTAFHPGPQPSDISSHEINSENCRFLGHRPQGTHGQTLPCPSTEEGLANARTTRRNEQGEMNILPVFFRSWDLWQGEGA